MLNNILLNITTQLGPGINTDAISKIVSDEAMKTIDLIATILLIVSIVGGLINISQLVTKNNNEDVNIKSNMIWLVIFGIVVAVIGGWKLWLVF